MGSWVADVWRKQRSIGRMPANDDSELRPRGDGNEGDGFTLYEEYRGFVVNGRHVEGDPERRDFFVLNLAGADAAPGIALFEEISQLRVHSRLRRSEMSEELRLMNGNHADAPHRVDQHGVWIRVFLDDPGFVAETIRYLEPGFTGSSDAKEFLTKRYAGSAQRPRRGQDKLGDVGAVTALTRDNVAGRPGITKGIGILARDDIASIFNNPYSLPMRDQAIAYDRAIAHELLHSVGVEHHGKGNYVRTFYFQHANDPANPLRRARFSSVPVESWDERVRRSVDQPPPVGTTLRLIEEGTNRDLVEPLAAAVEETLRIQRTMKPDLHGVIANVYPRLHVGIEHGEDSGDQDCVMRYYFAQAYGKNGSNTDYFYIPPGTNPIGVELCELPTGTGINAAGRKPQSRHGDAAPGHGNCAAQVNPNDAVPPRKQ